MFLRKNRAQVRYSLWLMASVKFFVPFSILVAFGGLVGRHTTTTAPAVAGFSSLAEQISTPFPATVPQLTALPVQGSYTMAIVAFVLGAVWATGFRGLGLSLDSALAADRCAH